MVKSKALILIDEIKEKHLGKIIFVLLLALFIIFGVGLFVKSEHTIYYWDYAREWNTFKESGTLIEKEGLLVFLNQLIDSIRTQEYNLFPIAPLLFFYKLFGSSRLVYILSISLLYGLGVFACFAHFISRILAKDEKVKLFLPLVLTLSLFIPQFWYPTLRGFLDVGGLMLIYLIYVIHFQRFGDFRSTLLQIIFLVSLIVFRRYYFFWVIAYLVVWLTETLIDGIYNKTNMVKPLLRIAIIAFITGSIYYVLAYPLSYKYLSSDNLALYSAWELNSFSQFLIRSFQYYGGLLVFMVLLGIIFSIKMGHKRISIFLFLQSVIALLLVKRIQDPSPQHYYLLIPAISFLIFFFWMGIARRTTGIFKVVPVILIFLWLENWIYVLSFSRPPTSLLFSKMSVQPLVRHDLTELRDLNIYLQNLQQQDPGGIYVLASSEILNGDIIIGSCREYFTEGENSVCSNFVDTKEIDSRDGTDIDLSLAKYIITSNPIEYHLPPDRQTVIINPAKMLLENRGLGQQYRRLQQSFELQNDLGEKIQVYIYKKYK